jgi:hypothetical protein
MAINSECPGLKVEVLVEGQALQEYDNDDDEESSPKVTTKYIEAHSDKDFALRTTFSAPFPSQYGVAAHVRVDGMAETGIAYELGDLNGQQGYIKEGICMKKDGAWSQYKYHFTTLNIGELQHCQIPFHTNVLQPKMSIIPWTYRNSGKIYTRRVASS